MRKSLWCKNMLLRRCEGPHRCLSECQSWVKDPIDPTRLKRRRTLEWQEKFALLGWWGESILILQNHWVMEFQLAKLGRFMFQFPGQAQEIPWKKNSSSNRSQDASLNGLGWASSFYGINCSAYFTLTPSCCEHRIRWTTYNLSVFPTQAFQIPSLQVAESIWRFEGMPSRFRNLSTMGNIWLDARFIRSERLQMVTRENWVTGLEIHAILVDIRLMNRHTESHTTDSCIHSTWQLIPFPCSIDPNSQSLRCLTLGRLHPESASSSGSSPLWFPWRLHISISSFSK